MALREFDRSYIEDKNLKIEELHWYQRVFARALRKEYDPDDFIHRSYNVVSDWKKIHDLFEEGREDLVEMYLQEIRFNLRTNLMERYHVVESGGEYHIQHGHLFSEFFKQKPMVQVLYDGVKHRKELGTPEPEREGLSGELGGFLFIDKLFSDESTSIGTTVVSFSPPGIVEDTAYKGKFIDIFTLKSRPTGNYVQRTRMAVDYSYEQYTEKAIDLNTEYFSLYDGRPIDAWFLSHPQVTMKDVSQLFQIGKGMSIREFDKIYNGGIFQGVSLLSLQEYYISLIQQDPPPWIKIAEAFNAFINAADRIKHELEHQEVTTVRRNPGVYDDRTMLLYQVQVLGKQPVQVISGGGCPDSKGYNLNGIASFSELTNDFFVTNSVAQFDTSISVDYKHDPNLCKKCPGHEPHFHCPKCRQEIVVGKHIETCPNCGEGKKCA